MTVKRYEIGGVAYEQRPLVLGQLKQIRQVLDGLVIPSSAGAQELIMLLEDRLPMALAVVLTPEGASIKGKDLSSLAETLEYEIESEQVMTVIEDFFDCNPVVSVVEKLAGAMRKINRMIPMKTGLTPSASSSPMEISPDGMQFSGDSPPENVSPT